MVLSRAAVPDEGPRGHPKRKAKALARELDTHTHSYGLRVDFMKLGLPRYETTILKEVLFRRLSHTYPDALGLDPD